MAAIRPCLGVCRCPVAFAFFPRHTCAWSLLACHGRSARRIAPIGVTTDGPAWSSTCCSSSFLEETVVDGIPMRATVREVCRVRDTCWLALYYALLSPIILTSNRFYHLCITIHITPKRLPNAAVTSQSNTDSEDAVRNEVFSGI